MDRRRSLLVNAGETQADAVLRDIANEFDVRVFTKPRLADVVDINRSGLAHDLFSYAFKAHLDFVIARGDDAKALFAVEFDGSSHSTVEAQQRDAKKDEVCSRLGLPLIRVGTDFLQTVKGFRLLAWLVELWFLDEAVTEAQERGEIPWDEVFDAHSFIGSDEKGRMKFPYDLASEARAFLWKAHEEGRTLVPVPTHSYRTTDRGGEAYAYLPVPGGLWLISHVHVRASFALQLSSPGDLAEDLATLEIAAKVEEYERGGIVAGTADEVEAIAKRCARWSGGGCAFP